MRRRAAQWHWVGYLFDIGMEAFAGDFLASPAFIHYFMSSKPNDPSDGVRGLQSYLNCNERAWRRFSALFP